MQDLRVIGVENGALLVASDDGTRYRIAIDEMMQSRLRQALPDPGTGRKLAPKDIQAHIRSGMSAHDVAEVTGASIEYIQRFEGPVLAEREFVVESALGVAVHTAADTDPLAQGKTFGTAIRERLHDLGGSDERWASWKDAETGWIVKLAFTADQIDHDARWQFDPKKQSLVPLNNQAVTLSQQGDAAGALMPRLRAVTPTDSNDPSRFDSGAFALEDEAPESSPAPEPLSFSRTAAPAEESAVHGNQTADLLEALRRRRGERESASFDDDDAKAAHPSTGTIRVVDVTLPDMDEPTSPKSTSPQPRVSKKGRTAMPSWDEIVFGARSDDDLA